MVSFLLEGDWELLIRIFEDKFSSGSDLHNNCDKSSTEGFYSLVMNLLLSLVAFHNELNTNQILFFQLNLVSFSLLITGNVNFVINIFTVSLGQSISVVSALSSGD